MQAVILCGGQGMRLREYTRVVPKPMVEVGGRPILWHIMKVYSRFGIDDFTLCLGYKGDVIRRYFLEYDILRCDSLVDLRTRRVTQLEPFHHEDRWQITLAETGSDTMTGGRVKRIEKFIDQGTFMLTYGDGVADIDLDKLLAFHRSEGCTATVMAVPPVARFGELMVDGNRAVGFQEKPRVRDAWINAGFFVFERGIFDLLGDDNCILEQEPLQALARDGQLAVYRHEGYWRCMDTARDVLALNAECAEGGAPWAAWESE